MKFRNYLFSGLTVSLAWASGPDAGSISQDIEKQLKHKKQLTPSGSQLTLQQDSKAASDITGTKVIVKEFKLSGNTMIPTSELNNKPLRPFIGKTLSFSQLEDATRAIADYYRDKGYQARAFFPPQEIENGKIEVIILEGKLSATEIEAESIKRLSVKHAQKIIESSHPLGNVLEVSKLERGLMILNDSPGVTATSQLEAGLRAGDSKLKVKLQDTPLLNGAVMVSNSGSRSTGHNQVIVSLGINSPASQGDQLTIQTMTTAGIRYGKVGYSLPWGYSGARVGASISKMGYEVVSGAKADGTADTMGLTASYPIIRSSSKNLIFSSTLDKKLYSNYSASTLTSDKEVNVLANTLSYSTFDGFGQTNINGTWTLGNLNLKKCESDFIADQQTKQASGRYSKFLLSISRTTMMNATTSFMGTFTTQKTNKNIDSSERMYLGGSSAVRAYPSNEAGGDQGYIINFELTKALPQNIQVALFYDYGKIEQNYQLYTGALTTLNPKNTYNLQGWGTSVSYTQGALSLKGSMVWRTGANPNTQANGGDNDGTKDIPRLWMSASYAF